MSPLAAFRHPGRERPSTAGWILTLAGAALILCTVAILNGGPIYYPDSGAYLLDADRLFHAQPPYAVRPVFYGIWVALSGALWPLPGGAGFALALFVQALIVAHIIGLTVRAVGAGLRPGAFLLLTAALVLSTPLSFHVSHILPDIYLPVLSLAVFLLAFCSDTLRRAETIYLFLLAAASASFHLTALPVAAAIVALAALLALCRRRWSRPVLAAGPLLLAVLALLAFSAAVFQRVALTPNSPPHLLARLLADGPGADYLRATCPDSGYTLCRYLDRLPATEDGFLWHMLPSLPTRDGYRIKAEQGQVVRGTLAMFPAQVGWHALVNTARQLVTFKAETQVSRTEWAEFLASNVPWVHAYAATRQARESIAGPALDMINTIHSIVAVMSLLLALATVPRLLAAGLIRPAMLTATTLLVLLANAFACGALGGVFARYQGRVIWLLPLAAAAALICVKRQTKGAD